MNTKQDAQNYERTVTGAERFFSHAPFSTVTIVARIKGQVTEKILRNAVEKIQQRYNLLQARTRDDQNEKLWFTSQGVQEIPIEIVPRKSENDWTKIQMEGSQTPYKFETRPAIQFILVQSPDVSEIIILCHHIICDDLSLAYLARDLMMHLGDPRAEARVRPAPEPISLRNLQSDVALSGLIKYFINKTKQKWADEIVHFDQEDYVVLNKAYWDTYHHGIFSVELSEVGTATRSRGAEKRMLL